MKMAFNFLNFVLDVFSENPIEETTMKSFKKKQKPIQPNTYT